MRSAALVCVLLVSAVLVSPAANAHVKTFNANLSLQYKSRTQTFFGTLGTNRKCKGNRLVTLFDADTNSPVATTTTNRNGRYSISLAADGGLYYARVQQEVRGGYGHVHRCRGDRSRTIDTSPTTGILDSGQTEGAPVSIFPVSPTAGGALPFTGTTILLIVAMAMSLIVAGIAIVAMRSKASVHSQRASWSHERGEK